MDNTIIACELPIEARDTRVDQISVEMLTHATRIEELPDGYEFFFTNDATWIVKLAQFIESERGCCGFFLFELVIRPQNGTISLRMRGEAEVKQFMKGFGLSVGNVNDAQS